MRPASGGFESPSFFSKFYSKHGQARDEIPFQMNSAMSGTVEDIEGQPVQTTELKASYEIDCTDQLKDLSNMDADLGNLPSKVVIFSRSTCPYCLELKRSLASYGVDYATVEVDRHESCNQLTVSLKSAFNYQTFPMLIVDGKLIGGCAEFKALENARDLHLLAPYITIFDGSNVGPRRVSRVSPFFWFPDTINNNASRAGGWFIVLYGAVCIGMFHRFVTRWAVLALAIDYTARFFFGPNISAIGTISALVVSGFEPDFRTGAPKQFAAFWGCFFSVFSAGLWLGHYEVGGCVLLGFLMTTAFLEACFDICVPSIVFGYAVHWGLVDSHALYRPSINLRANKQWVWRSISRNPTVYQRAVNEHVLLPEQNEPSEIDLVRKGRFDMEYKNKDIGLIRFTKISFFLMPMTVATLAYAYNLLTGDTLIGPTGEKVFNWGYGPRGTSDALGITAAVLFILMGIAYLIRLVAYRKKCMKELTHPVTGSYFSAVSICLSFFGLLMYSRDRYFGIAMVWGASVFQMLLLVTTAGRFVFTYTSEEMVKPSVLLLPVGNFICAIALSRYPFDPLNDFTVISQFGVNYVFLARFWAASAMLFSIVFFTITFRLSVSDSHADNRNRLDLWCWQAAAGVAGPALYAVTGEGFQEGLTFSYQSFWLIGLFFFAINCVGWLRGFYFFSSSSSSGASAAASFIAPISDTGSADMAIWIMPFACSAMAISTIHYHSFVANDKVTEIFVYFAVAIASFSTAMCAVYTAIWAFNLSLFKPRLKWGPLEFMKLTHEAFRVAVPQLKRAVQELDAKKPYTFNVFFEQVEPFLLAYKVHKEQEENVLFPAARAVYPELHPVLDEQLEETSFTLRNMEDAMKVLKNTFNTTSNTSSSTSSAPTSAPPRGGSHTTSAVNILHSVFPGWADNFLTHLREEELTTMAVLRKHVSIDRHLQLTKQSYTVIDAEDWHVVIPYIITRLPNPAWKTRFLRSFLWAMPDRAQEIGLMLYRGLDSVQFALVAEETPEIIPRGVYGYMKKY